MATSARDPGVILADAAYSLDQVNQRIGLGAAALRTARRNGLIVRRVGRRSFIMGRDLLAYIDTNAKVVDPSGSAE